MKALMNTLVFGLGTIATVAAAQPPQHMAPASITGSAPNAVTVQNDRKVPVIVYMDDDGFGDVEARLGVVPAHGTASLPLPRWAVQGRDSVRFVAEPEGEVDEVESSAVALQPNAPLTVEVPPFGYAPPPAPDDTMTAAIPPRERSAATITVDNPRSDAVTVVAEEGDVDVRVGEVPAHSRVTLEFPRSVVGPEASFRLFVVPRDGLELSSEMLDVTPGEHLGLRVPSW